jgi:hypothetical protein
MNERVKIEEAEFKAAKRTARGAHLVAVVVV